jgi:hypothetical protein
MNQSEALSLAVEMLERVAPGTNYDTREFYERLRDIKATIPPADPDPKNIDLVREGAKAPPKPAPAPWPRTAILDGEEFCEVDRRMIEGRELILMESCRDGSEAPAIIVDANTNETVLEEACNGFEDYLGEAAFSSQAGGA